MTEADHIIRMRGHSREPSTFREITEGPKGITRVVRSYVAYDAGWPWWRRFLAGLRGRGLR